MLSRRKQEGARRATLVAWISLAASIAALGSSPAATAATTVGQTFAPDSPGTMSTYLQTGSPGGLYTVPSAGVITSWSHQAPPDAQQLKLKLGRAAGGNAFTIVGESVLQGMSPNSFNTFAVRIAVQAGDVLGVYAGTNNVLGRSPAPGYSHHVVGTDVPAGSTATFMPPFAGFQLDVSAVLEPDCDSDGFGDETQDAEIPAIASCDPNPPDTTITNGPKDKTKKKQATFEFSSNEPGSTFECSLDGGAFAPCSSPDTLKVKKGKHSFQVRAGDAAGNLDGSPASDDWKVKKKKQRK